jgi:hypothetical protein
LTFTKSFKASSDNIFQDVDLSWKKKQYFDGLESIQIQVAFTLRLDSCRFPAVSVRKNHNHVPSGWSWLHLLRRRWCSRIHCLTTLLQRLPSENIALPTCQTRRDYMPAASVPHCRYTDLFSIKSIGNTPLVSRVQLPVVYYFSDSGRFSPTCSSARGLCGRR